MILQYVNLYGIFYVIISLRSPKYSLYVMAIMKSVLGETKLTIKNELDLCCPECESKNLQRDEANGEVVCLRCGLVLSAENISLNPEWRNFIDKNSDVRERVGAPLTNSIHDNGLSTEIDWRNIDTNGRKIDPDIQDQMDRVRKWHNRTKFSTSRDRNLSHAFQEMTGLCMKLHLPKNVSETSSTIYRKAFKKDLIRGRSIRRGVAAAIYMACRQCNVIRSIKEIERASLIPSKDIARTYRFLRTELSEEVPQSRPKRYVAKIVNQLKLPGYVENMSGKIIDQSSKLGILNGRSPAVLPLLLRILLVC